MDLSEINLLPSLGEMTDRDYKLCGALNYEKELEFLYKLPAKDQGRTMKCVSYSHSTVLEMELDLSEPLSHDFIYFNRDLVKEAPFQGYYNIAAETHLLNDGVCLFKDYSTNEEAPDGVLSFLKIKDSLLEKASNYKIKAHFGLNGIEEIKSFMSTYKCPAIISIAVYESVTKIGKDGIFPMSSGALHGYHSVPVVGYNDKYLKILNSCGPNWGDNGYGYIPIDDTKVLQEARGFIIDNNKSVELKNIEKPKDSPVLYRVQISANAVKEYAIAEQQKLAKIELNNVQISRLGTMQNYLGSCLIFEKRLYKCQVGSFAEKRNAEKLLTVLRELGYKDAWITEYHKQ